MSKDFDLFNVPLKDFSLVEAGAGTGKTYNIASIYVRCILERELMPANILVLTFTEAATAELKSRLRRRIKESIDAIQNGLGDYSDSFLNELSKKYSPVKAELLKSALYKFDEAAISTIHGFCQKVLGEFSSEFEVASEFEILADETELLQEIADDFWRDFFSSGSGEFESVVQQFILHQGYTPEKLSEFVKKALAKPYAQIIPETPAIGDFESLYNNLSSVFENMRETFIKEESLIDEIFLSDVLNGNRYQKKELQLFSFKNWIKRNQSPFIAHEKCYWFSSFMIDSGLKKRKEIPTLKLHAIVDKYMELEKSFSLLEQSWLAAAIKEIQLHYQSQKDLKNLLTYSDLLMKVAEGVSSTPQIANQLNTRFPVALIDEFQDTDPVQYLIFKSVYQSKTDNALFMIGDPKQAIYSFRGGDIYTYFAARNDSNAVQRYSLRYNYRSSALLIEAVNALFNATEQPFFIDGLQFEAAKFPKGQSLEKEIFRKGNNQEKPLQFIELKDSVSNAAERDALISKSVVSEILNLLLEDFLVEDKKIQSGDIAVLVRTHKQARSIQDALLERGLKSIINSKESVYNSEEAKEVYLVLSAVLNPTFEDGIRAALATEMMGFKASDIQRLLHKEIEWSRLYSEFISFSKLWHQKGISSFFMEFLQTYPVEVNFAKLQNSERKLTNLYHLFELIGKMERESGFSPNALLKNFRLKMEGQGGNPSDEEIIRLESDEDSIQIVTMHNSKGLEYPVVLCPFLWEGIKTDDRGNFNFHKEGKDYFDISKKGEFPEHEELLLKERLAEQIRLTYVALTRAKSACFVYLMDQSGSELSSLASLLEGKKVLEVRIYDKVNASNYSRKHKPESGKLNGLISEKISHDYIELREPVNRDGRIDLESKKKRVQFLTKEFNRTDLFDFSRVTSFSSLSRIPEKEALFLEKPGFDYDEITRKSEVGEQEIYDGFTLPKGAKTGTVIHEIFEEITFNDPDTVKPGIELVMKRHNFDPEWEPVLYESIRKSLFHPLSGNFALSKLKPEQCLKEMEFYFPNESISANGLLNIIRGTRDAFNDSNPVYGFLKGFIDLIFEYEGRYYILDYKSNHLGNSFKDYDPELIDSEMKHSMYDLQYHLYTIALNRVLNTVLPDYSYSQDFGGVIYLFVRGVESNRKGSGVFFSKPDEKTILTLENYLSGDIK